MSIMTPSRCTTSRPTKKDAASRPRPNHGDALAGGGTADKVSACTSCKEFGISEYGRDTALGATDEGGRAEGPATDADGREDGAGGADGRGSCAATDGMGASNVGPGSVDDRGGADCGRATIDGAGATNEAEAGAGRELVTAGPSDGWMLTGGASASPISTASGTHSANPGCQTRVPSSMTSRS